MKLYIANCTKQRHDFVYRVPESGQIRRQMIIEGAQAQVHNDSSLEHLKAIVDQHLKYGLVAVDEIDRTRAFVGMCYSFDKPIDVDAIMRAADHNDGVLVERGIEMRKATAVAVQTSLVEAGTGVTEVATEVVEEAKADNPSGPRMAQGVRVRTPGARSRRDD